jgi:predicted kinase
MGTLTVFAGPACSGKTTLAGILAVERNWPHLAMDATRVRLMPDSGHTRGDRAIAYRAMHLAAELLLTHGVHTILDAPYGHRSDREEIAELAGRAKASMLLVECAVTPEAAAERHRARAGGHPGLDLTPGRVVEIVRGYRFSRLGLMLDTSRQSLHECMARLRDYLEAGKMVVPAEWARASVE